MIIEHYAAFKTELKSSELNQENWDVLRTISEEKAYAIEDDIESYEKNCRESVSYGESSKDIIDVLNKYMCKHVVALGAGKGILEWHLKKKQSDLFIECTDYASMAVEKLKKVFVDCDVIFEFDMMNGDYRVFDNNAFFILYRVSEEFCFSDWCTVLQKMRESKIKNIIYIPDMIATIDLAQQMKRSHERNIEKGIQDTFCGWIYSEDMLEKMFSMGGYQIIEKRMAGELVLYLLGLEEK